MIKEEDGYLSPHEHSSQMFLMNIPTDWLAVSNTQPLLCIPPRDVGPFWMTLEEREKGKWKLPRWYLKSKKTEPRPSLHHLGKRNNTEHLPREVLMFAFG